MSKFKIGQAVALLISFSGCYIDTTTGARHCFDAKKGRIYHVAGMWEDGGCFWYVLRELSTPGMGTLEQYLLPVEEASDEAIAELLEEALQRKEVPA